MRATRDRARRRDSTVVSSSPPIKISKLPRNRRDLTLAPVYGSCDEPCAIVVAVVAVVSAVNGRADELVGVVLDEDTCGGFVVVVFGVWWGTVVVVVVVVVVDAGTVQLEIVWSCPCMKTHGFGPIRASAWMTPQKNGYSSLSIPELPDTAPSMGCPAIRGSFMNSNHWQSECPSGHAGVGMTNVTVRATSSKTMCSLGVAPAPPGGALWV